MRLASIITAAGPRAAIFHGDHYTEIYASDLRLPQTVRGILAAGPDVLKSAENAAKSRFAVHHPAATIRLHAPIPDPSKIVCIGLNYRNHAIEGGRPIPTEPVVFAKYPNTLVGPDSPIVLPKLSQKVDYEAELVAVIGRRAKQIEAAEAMSYVAGFTIGNDVSARDWQFRGEERQWTIGKTFDTFGPTGPFLVTLDEVPDPNNLAISLKLNGQVMQNSNTKEFIFPVPVLIAHLSKIMTLEPGDLIFTGTPPGVGSARKPPVWLKDGDDIEVEIEGLGVLRNPVTAEFDL
jgi:2-keto-4-pentenoate hydratase/2-oxohepta-3-ene-1,7-dioic acid hydratase in catechol pathway